MNKRKGYITAALIHLILSGIPFLFFVVGAIDYVRNQTMEFLDANFIVGLMIIGGIVFFNGLLLYFAVRRVCRYTADEKKKSGVVALCFSAAATLSFYVAVGLLFGINKDWLAPILLILGFLWLVGTIVSGVMLLVNACHRAA